MADDIYPGCHIHTEENSYCVANCHILNEGKLVARCPTGVHGLMKYRLGGTTYMHAISDFFIQYMTSHVRTEEMDSYIPNVNGFGQNAEWHVRNFWPNEI